MRKEVIGNATLYQGDCLEIMPMLIEEGVLVDSIVTDPPAGISFMGKDWDDDKGGRKQWVEWMQGVQELAIQLIKGGGHSLTWSLPRTSHWTGWALENAGWEPRDTILHIFGSGFPKSLDISKALDKMAPATPEAKQWEGWGSCVKPAFENWILCRKNIDLKDARYIILEIEKTMEIFLCQLLAFAKYAELNLTSSQKDLDVEKSDFAHKNAVKSLIKKLQEKREKTDIYKLQVEGLIHSNTVLLWQNILEESLSLLNKFTTETNNVMIIELKTLSLLISENILPYIIKESKKKNGLNSNVCTVESSLTDWLLQLRDTLILFVQENVISKAISQELFQSELPLEGSEMKGGVSHETWWLCRKPLAEKTIVENVLKHGTGALNIDGCRIETEEKIKTHHYDGSHGFDKGRKHMEETETNKGRFPSNLIHDGSPEVMKEFDKYGVRFSSGGCGEKTRKANSMFTSKDRKHIGFSGGVGGYKDTGTPARYFKTCPPDESNFFYSGKASKADKNNGGDNIHLTCKPTSLMSYLCRLITPPGGLILDMFMGSGSTGVSACKEGFSFIGIELSQEYFDIACKRVEDATKQPDMFYSSS